MSGLSTRGYLSSRASVSSGALIAPTVCIYGRSVISSGAVIEHGAVIGHPSPSEQQQLLVAFRSETDFDSCFDIVTEATTYIGPNVVVRSGTVIYSGTSIDKGVDIAHNCVIRENSAIGSDTHILSCSQLMAHVTIGVHCRVSGTLCNRTQVGHFSSMLGHAMHSYRLGLPGMVEPSPIVGNGVIVGRETSLIGKVVVHDFACVGAGSVLTHDAPQKSLWLGNPARFIRERTEDEIRTIRTLMENYAINQATPSS